MQLNFLCGSHAWLMCIEIEIAIEIEIDYIDNPTVY